MDKQKNNVVNDYYHKISYNIVKYYKFIAMETLNIRAMLKGNLSRSIHEIRWGKLIEMIKYKAQWYNRQFIHKSTDASPQVKNAMFAEKSITT